MQQKRKKYALTEMEMSSYNITGKENNRFYKQ